MCRVPDQEDAKYKDDEDAYEDDLEEMQTKTDAIKPKENFQPENMANLVYSSMTPLKIYEGGDKPL